jgi:hypothetical protein
VNLRGAHLKGADLGRRNLRGADLQNARLAGANLREADLRGANLAGADLSGCELSDALADDANFQAARLAGATAIMAYCTQADFTDADASGVDFSDSFFFDARFVQSNLAAATFDGAMFGGTVFAGVDLSETIGLADAHHGGPSVVDHRTLQTATAVPLAFLRGCGLPENLITQLDALFGQTRYHSCFLSYASADERFARKLEGSLLDHGIRCWFAPTSMRVGAPVKPTLEAQVRQHGRFVVILSSDSLRSEWVRTEVEYALQNESAHSTASLMPLRIDDEVLRSRTRIAGHMRERSIMDFTRWETRRAYRSAIDRLVHSLEITPDHSD